jgi:hypothetical protein
MVDEKSLALPLAFCFYVRWSLDNPAGEAQPSRNSTKKCCSKRKSTVKKEYR